MRNCVNCKHEIEPARLEALPDTELCIGCARKINIPRRKERVRYDPTAEPTEWENAE